VAQMRVARSAQHLGASHQVAGVLGGAHVLGRSRSVEARPAATGVELGFGVEEQGSAAGAAIASRFVGVPILSAEGRLGAFLAGDAVLFRRARLSAASVLVILSGMTASREMRGS
jgi:hypothetical protein